MNGRYPERRKAADNGLPLPTEADGILLAGSTWGSWGSVILAVTLTAELLAHPSPAQLERIAVTDDTIRWANPAKAWTLTSTGDGIGKYQLERARTLAIAELTRPVIFTFRQAPSDSSPPYFARTPPPKWY